MTNQLQDYYNMRGEISNSLYGIETSEPIAKNVTVDKASKTKFSTKFRANVHYIKKLLIIR